MEEDQGDCSGLQDRARPASSAHHQRCCSGVSEQRDIPWCAHLPRPVLEHQHYISGQKKKAQHLCFLQKLRRAGAPASIMYSRYRGTAPLREFWPAASLCDMTPAPSPAVKPCSALWERPSRSFSRSGHLQHLPHLQKLPGLQVSPPTHILIFSACCHWGGDCRVSGTRAADSNRGFFFSHQAVTSLSLLCPPVPPPLTLSCMYSVMWQISWLWFFLRIGDMTGFFYCFKEEVCFGASAAAPWRNQVLYTHFGDRVPRYDSSHCPW